MVNPKNAIWDLPRHSTLGTGLLKPQEKKIETSILPCTWKCKRSSPNCWLQGGAAEQDTNWKQESTKGRGKISKVSWLSPHRNADQTQTPVSRILLTLQCH